MKKASKILLIIAGVFNLLACIALAITGIVYAVIAFVGGTLIFQDMGVEIQEFFQEMGASEVAMKWLVAAAFALIYLVVFGLLAIIYLVGAIIAFKGSKPKKKGIFIANIVFAVLCENIFALVGGILGLIGFKPEEQQEEPLPEPEPAPVEEEPKQLEEPKVEEAPVVEEKKEEPKPEAPKKAAREDWFCPNCGAHNTSKFCASCGTKRPE